MNFAEFLRSPWGRFLIAMAIFFAGYYTSFVLFPTKPATPVASPAASPASQPR